ERGHGERREHADRQGDARQDPGELPEVYRRGTARRHGSAPPDAQIGIEPEHRQDREIDQDEDERAPRPRLVVVRALVHGWPPSGFTSPSSRSTLPPKAG